MLAIVTRFHHATNTRGARISARYDDKKIVRPYSHLVNSQENHEDVARQLAAWLASPENSDCIASYRANFAQRLIGASIDGGTSYAFVFIDRATTDSMGAAVELLEEVEYGQSKRCPNPEKYSQAICDDAARALRNCGATFSKRRTISGRA